MHPATLHKKGFTLIELLIVIGIIGFLAAAILVAVDPIKRIQESRDARRFSEVNGMLNAILNKQTDDRAYFAGDSTAPIVESAANAQVIVRDASFPVNIDCDDAPALADNPPTCPQASLPLNTVASGKGCVAQLKTVLQPPATPGITTIGTTGTTTWKYKVTARNAKGETVPSTEVTTTTGNATLDATNFNRITWTAVSGATDYRVYRTTAGGTPSTTGLIGTTASTTLDDTGLAASGSTPTSNSAVLVGSLSPTYISDLPIDPGTTVALGGTTPTPLGEQNTGYYIVRDPTSKRITIGACFGEQNTAIKTTR